MKCPICDRKDIEIEGISFEGPVLETDQGQVHLTFQEKTFFEALAASFPNHVSVDSIIQSFYRGAIEPEDARGVCRAVAYHVREKVEPLGLRIKCSYGYGYALERGV